MSAFSSYFRSPEASLDLSLDRYLKQRRTEVADARKACPGRVGYWALGEIVARMTSIVQKLSRVEYSVHV